MKCIEYPCAHVFIGYTVSFRILLTVEKALVHLSTVSSPGWQNRFPLRFHILLTSLLTRTTISKRCFSNENKKKRTVDFLFEKLGDGSQFLLYHSQLPSGSNLNSLVTRMLYSLYADAATRSSGSRTVKSARPMVNRRRQLNLRHTISLNPSFILTLYMSTVNWGKFTLREYIILYLWGNYWENNYIILLLQ